MTDRPLSGLLVVSIEQAVAAPYCTSRLADAGARVIKVERPEGDFARGYDQAAAGESSYFVWLNRGKESLVLNLALPADRTMLQRICDDADVLVQNLKPGALERKGIGPEALRARNPALITCSISGYGETGPLADRKAYDLLIQAESGLCSITGGPDEPARVGISIVDIATGAAAHAAILEALIARGRHGKGCDIRISMFDVIADWMAVPFLHAAGGASPKRMGLSHPSISPYGVFALRDGQQVLISIQNDREWAGFARDILRRPDLALDGRFATNNDRVRNRAALDPLIAGIMRDHDRDRMAEMLQQAGIAFAALNDMDGLIVHPHLATARIDTPDGRTVPLPAPAARFDGRRHVLRAGMPMLDQHGPAIRAEWALRSDPTASTPQEARTR